MISSELSELMRLCDRIVVLREGQVSGECLRSEFDSQRLLSYAFGQ
jgi:ABC-type sugar transport system ATPase subunit